MPKTYKGLFKLFLILSIFTFLLYRLPITVRSAADHVVISEVQVGGGVSNDEFIELYNPTSANVDISNWTLMKKTALGIDHDTLATLPASTIISTHGYFLVAHTDYDGSTTEDFTYSGSTIIAPNNTIYLHDNTGATIDKLGMGTTNDFEGTVFPSTPGDNKSLERKAQASSDETSMGLGGSDELMGNGEDTNNNASDFFLRNTPDPQNTDSDPELPATPTPTESPTSTPTASPTDTPSPSPEESPSPSPSPTETATPTATPTESPTPTPTPASTATVEPTATPTETPEPTPTSTPKIIGIFRFPGKTTTCSITYEARTVWFLKFIFPKITCD